MNAQTAPSDALTALLTFWHEAGVEDAYEDAPVDRVQVIGPSASPPAGAANVSPLHAAPQATGSGASGAETRADLARAVAEARALAGQADSLDTLTDIIRAFDGCPLSRMGARQAVVWRGTPDAPLVIVGEGPGADEDRLGHPFVGKAGRLLDRMLQAAGLADRVLITNSVFWRPPGNRTPTPEEQAVCAPFVERILTLTRPRLVLALGAAAARSLLATSDGIMRLRGDWRDWKAADGGVQVPLMPSLHPAFLLRQPQAKALAWQDLLSVAARLEEAGDSNSPH